jgi:hypothetical protein
MSIELKVRAVVPKCDQCGGDDTEIIVGSVRPGEQPDTVCINSLKKKEGGFVLSGTISSVLCLRCGAAISYLTTEVPVELDHLVCDCSAKTFAITLRSIEMEKKKTEPNWQFQLDVDCESCKQTKFKEKVASLFRLKRIKVGLTGIDIQLK